MSHCLDSGVMVKVEIFSFPTNGGSPFSTSLPARSDRGSLGGLFTNRMSKQRKISIHSGSEERGRNVPLVWTIHKGCPEKLDASYLARIWFCIAV